MKPILKGLAALIVMTLLPIQAQALDPVTRQIIVSYTKIMSEKYGVDAAFALAVAHIESRAPGQEFRHGLLAGKWYGPFNIHKDYLNKWPVDELQENCKRGVMALRGTNQRQILRRYNAEFNQAYYLEIEKAILKYRRELENFKNG